MPLLLSPRKNLLVYPAGIVSGFDPTHMAAKNILQSVISQPSGPISTLSGETYSSSPTAPISSIDAIIGPYFSLSAGEGVFNMPAPTLTKFSGGWIGKISTINSPRPIEYVGAGVGGLFQDIGGNFRAWTPATNICSFSTSSVLVAGVPYFIGFSVISGGTGNLVLLNLNTGALSTFTATCAAFTDSGLAGQYRYGAAVGSYDQKTAANCMSNQYLSMQQLLQWAQDPWSFWYPKRIDLAQMLRVVPTVGVPPAPALLQIRSAPGLGPQSRYTSLLNAALPTPAVAPTITGSTLPTLGVG